MWELRLILVLLGVVVVAGVYLFSRQNRKLQARRPPLLDEAALPEIAPAAAIPEENPVSRRGGDPVPDRQMILALHVAPEGDGPFPGSQVLEAFRSLHLQFGNHRVFHRLMRGAPDASVFSVANMLEPGVFDPAALPQMTLPGLTLFMVLPGPQPGVSAYADMLVTARKLAQQLGGQVLDESRSTLTRQTAHHIRERIIEFEHHAQVRRQS